MVQAKQARIHWSSIEQELVLQEAARLRQNRDTRRTSSLLVDAQKVLPADRRRVTRLPDKHSITPAIQLNPAVRKKFDARIAEILASPKPEPTPQPTPPPAPEAPAPEMPGYMRSAQDELANYGIAELIAATLTRLLEIFTPGPALQSSVTPAPFLPPAKPAYPLDTNGLNGTHVERKRRVRIVGVGFLPVQSNAIANRFPEVDFTWIAADENDTWVPPSMDYAVMSRFCQHRWSKYLWGTLGQQRAPRVTGGITEVERTIRKLLARREELATSLM